MITLEDRVMMQEQVARANRAERALREIERVANEPNVNAAQVVLTIRSILQAVLPDEANHAR